jgi:hypothetical protein
MTRSGGVFIRYCSIKKGDLRDISGHFIDKIMRQNGHQVLQVYVFDELNKATRMSVIQGSLLTILI